MKDPFNRNMIILFAILMGCLSYGSFRLERWDNYKFGYEEKVQTEIGKMVKRECLR